MNKYGNIASMMERSSGFWTAAREGGLGGIVVDELLDGGRLLLSDGRVMTNMSSYAYLGLDEDPRIRRGAESAVRQYGINTSMSRTRGVHRYLRSVEEKLSAWLGGQVMLLSSCTAAAASLIPALSAGVGLARRPNIVAYDRSAHFCMNVLKPQVADETNVVTIRHNDVGALAGFCANNSSVLYVADGVYSTGGLSPVSEIAQLQNRYDLKVVYDEAHGLSVMGERGIGYVLQSYGEFRDDVFLIASLNKGFGGAGGFMASSRANARVLQQVAMAGGPIQWSQRPTFGNLGAVEAALDIHEGPEFDQLQSGLADVVNLFDAVAPSGATTREPIRFIKATAGDGLALAVALANEGFYAAPISFPIVPHGLGGVRVMLRSNMERQEILRFGKVLEASGLIERLDSHGAEGV
ncbi:aminotransferase class I/II-fold pyridoxal phosphate-dependent enzyme [Frankia sp. CiP3]|uniref:aminotransferase class I/II-fold pyridoxal phosphate-dependent enzyme n=1 Tax=Frankia sp. CiP3 TaxID=2880971 RepID=UPI002101DFC5|nr:aminotransferase class I/II-fold pyridoxal phosphate-dependent enzyme [Frankia sp. CiP3]